MKNYPNKILAVMAAGLALAIVPSVTFAQGGQPSGTPPVDPATHAAHVAQGGAAHTQGQPLADTTKDLVEQVAALRAEVARLQAALVQGHSAQPPMNSGRGMGMGGQGMMPGRMGTGGPMQPMQQQPMPGMGGMPGMSGGQAGGMPGMPGGAGGAGGAGGSGMGMDQMMMGGMGGGAGGGGMSGMGMDGMMKMMGMGNMGGMPMGGAGSPAAMAMPSALPGFPGASHIYHVGATGFFLDHPEHITLTLEQQTALSQKKEQALLQQAEFQRKTEQAEQELWVLTAADQPDAAAIDKKVQEIARLQGDQRVAFIRAVGEAAKVLTDEQRKQLTGMLPAAPTPMAPAAAPGMPNM